MHFGNLLSFLISIANSSISELAEDLSYDRSYVSKWVNNKELPSHQKWEELYRDLVDFFDARISDLAIEKLILEYPILKIYRSGETKKDLISYCLSLAHESSANKSILLYDQEPDMVLYLNGKNKVEDYMLRLLTKDVHRLSNPGILYYKGDLVNLISDKTLDIFDMGFITFQSMNVKFSTVNFLHDYTDQKSSIKLLNRYFRLMGQFSYLSLEIYWPKNMNKEMVELAYKDRFYGWGFEVNKDVPNVLFISQDPKQLELNFPRIKEDFNDKKKVFAIEDNIKSITSRFNYIDPNAQPKTYIPKIYIFMGPESLRKDLYEKGYINKNENEIWKLCTKFMKSEKFKASKIIITRSSLAKLLNMGLVYRSNGSMKLVGQDFNKFSNHILDLLENKDLVIIEDQILDMAFRLPKVMIYADGSETYLVKFNDFTPYDYSRIIYKSYSSEFDSLADFYLRALANINDDNFLI